MQCDEFARTLQQQMDLGSTAFADASLEQHARICDSCRELHDGLQLLHQSFAERSLPIAGESLTDRICTAASCAAPSTYARQFLCLAAACAVAALGLYARYWPSSGNTLTPVAERRVSFDRPLIDDVLFPELIDPDTTDSRDSIALAETVEPVSRLLQSFGRSLRDPVVPIAISTTQAMSQLIRDVPDPESAMTPIPMMRGMMGPAPKKKMDPSS